MTDVFAYAVAAVIAICGAALIAMAGYLGLLEVVEPVFAALLTGVALLVIALIIVWLARTVSRRRARRRPRHDPIEAALREHADSLLSAGIRRHPAGAAVCTLLLGIAAGRARNGERERQSGDGLR